MKIQLSESVLSEMEAEVGTEVEEDKWASCCYVLLGRPKGENHCVSYSEAALRHAFSFGKSREAPLAESDEFLYSTGLQKERYSAQYFVTMSVCSVSLAILLSS